MVTNSIFRYYRPTSENLEALKDSYIYMFSATKFKGATEMQFEIDLSNPTELKEFIRVEIQKTKDLPKDSEDFEFYSKLRYQLLDDHGKRDAIALDTDVEHLTNIVFEDIIKDQKIGKRKGLIRNNFFTKTGVASFITDQTTLNEEEHWIAFASTGAGYCVEYDWPFLSDYFTQSKEGIRGNHIEYYAKSETPKIILSNSYSDAVMDNYSEIIFSLGQMMIYEKEFRLAKLFTEDVNDNDERRKIKIPAKSSKAIYAGPHIKGPDLKKLKDIVSGLITPPLLYLMKESGGTFIPVVAS